MPTMSSEEISGTPVESSPVKTVVRTGMSGAKLALLVIVIVAAGIRYLNFPHRYEVRDMDETGYLDGGLVLFEGITPAIRVAPAAPQSWITWAYAGVRSAEILIHPDSVMAAMSWEVRPFFAINASLFDIYQDMSKLRQFMLIIENIIAVAGVYGAFRLGAIYGRVWGGILTGGLAALLPLYVDFASMSRPYSDAWAFSFLTLYSAAGLRGKRRWIQTGIFLALAVGSRIDMLTIVPMVLWLFWDNREPGTGYRPAVKAVILGAVLTLLMSPWLIMAPIGIARTIATTRAAAWTSPDNPRLVTLLDVTWLQGLGPALLVILMLLIVPGTQRLRRWLLVALGGLIILSMFKGPYQPMRYHGAPMIAILMLITLGTGELARRWPKAAPVVVSLLLVLPMAQTIRSNLIPSSRWVPDEATAWIEKRVPAGTRVYDEVTRDLRPPLPTQAAADAAWDQVTDEQAWRKKFARGLSRFGLSANDTPRALSEDNLILDRGLWRRYFILGSNLQPDRPRYDLRPFGMGSQVFGVQDLAEEFAHNGGVVVWREGGPPVFLGKPIVQWTNSENEGIFVYCSPDVRARLKD